MKESNQVVVNQMKRNLPYAPKDFFNRLQQRLDRIDYTAQFANLYAEILTEDEMSKLIELYSSSTKSIANKCAIGVATHKVMFNN